MRFLAGLDLIKVDAVDLGVSIRRMEYGVNISIVLLKRNIYLLFFY